MATGVQTDNAFTLLDQVVHDAGGGGPVTHTHTQDEGLYVVSGQCTFNAGGHQGLKVAAGGFVAVPGDCEHSFTVDAPDTHMLNFYLPAGFEQLLIGIALPAPERKPPPPDKIMEMLPPKWIADKLSEDYGMDSRPANPFTSPPNPDLMSTKPTPGATVFPYTTHADDSPSYTFLNTSWTILADGQQTGGSYCLFQLTSRRGVLGEPRVFKERDEVIYVLDGELQIFLGDCVKKMSKGDMAFIPSGTLMSLRVDSQEAHLLDLHTVSGFEKFVQLQGTETTADTRKSPESDVQPKNVDKGTEDRLLRELGLTICPVEVSWA